LIKVWKNIEKIQEESACGPKGHKGNGEAREKGNLKNEGLDKKV